MKQVFQYKLFGMEFDLCIPISGYLSKIEIDNDFDGLKLKKITQQKALYLRPHNDLIEIDEDIDGKDVLIILIGCYFYLCIIFRMPNAQHTG